MERACPAGSVLSGALRSWSRVLPISVIVGISVARLPVACPLLSTLEPRCPRCCSALGAGNL
eukprot:2688728-Rhodomonas_salina.1